MQDWLLGRRGRLDDRLGGLALDLVHRHAREAFPNSGDCLASKLDTGSAFDQLAVILVGTALAQPIEQVGVDFDSSGRRCGHGPQR